MDRIYWVRAYVLLGEVFKVGQSSPSEPDSRGCCWGIRNTGSRKLCSLRLARRAAPYLYQCCLLVPDSFESIRNRERVSVFAYLYAFGSVLARGPAMFRVVRSYFLMNSAVCFAPDSGVMVLASMRI